MGGGGIAPPFLTSALDRDEWSASRPGRLTLGERAPSIHWIGGWLGSRASLLKRRKTSVRVPAEIQTEHIPNKKSQR
jgi:hypothetical protein